jgi:hypothetical protein
MEIVYLWPETTYTPTDLGTGKIIGFPEGVNAGSLNSTHPDSPSPS